MERDRNFVDPQVGEPAFDDHFAGELHAGHLQVHFRHGVFAKAAHAAERVAGAGPEEQVQEPTQAGIADPFVEPGHRAGTNRAFESIAHDDVGPAAQPVDEPAEIGEIVAVVAIAHDDVAAASVRKAAPQGVAVTLERMPDHAGPCSDGDLAAAVGMSRCRRSALHRLNAEPLHRLPSLVDADRQRALFVQARHHDSQFELFVGERA